MQNCPLAQSASLVQTETQLCVVALQANGKQDWVPAVLHVPAPSQLRARVAVVDPVGHAGGAHCVPAAYFAQAPAPLQRPVVPQLAAP